MTDADIKAMEELAENATKGPWWTADPESDNYNRDLYHGRYQVLCDRENNGGTTHARCLAQVNVNWDSCEDDGKFIAASRTFVPRAIAEIKRLRELVREAYDEGYDDGTGTWDHAGTWDNSNAKRALTEGSE